MIPDPHKDIVTIGIGGAAGDGVREAGQSLGTLLADLGYEVFISFTYPSLIRGGHNFSRVSFSKEKVWSDHSKLDVLIALNEESVGFHRAELNSDAVVFADKFEDDDLKILGRNAVVLPMASSSKNLGAPAITRNSVALGATCYLMDLHYPAMQEVLGRVFKDKKLEANIKLADIGFEFLKKNDFRHTKRLSPSAQKKEIVDGNTALARGLLAAGLDFYVGYPMTPATSILHYLAARQVDTPVKVIQPESELSVINMALGMSYAGKRVAIGSATGGFQLMQEGFGFAGIAELPLVVAVSQRQAPGTGLPTYSSQTDLRLIKHAGDGEFPKIVIAPGDTEEAFSVGATALNLAWKYQVPVIVLLDKILSEHSSSSKLDASQITVERGRLAKAGVETGEKYGRYEISADGISPLAFPGTPDTIVKVTSYEHDSHGITIEDTEPVKEMIDKRLAKIESLKSEMKKQETVKVFGDHKAKDVLVFWGSTKGPVLEAAKFLEHPVKLVQILWMEPFDSDKVMKELAGARRVINIECNHDAQLAGLIREKTGVEVTHNILRYDSRPLDPLELADEIEQALATDRK